MKSILPLTKTSDQDTAYLDPLYVFKALERKQQSVF